MQGCAKVNLYAISGVLETIFIMAILIAVGLGLFFLLLWCAGVIVEGP
jgi:hypothetical protein